MRIDKKINTKNINKESVITIKGRSFNEDEVKFRFSYRVDFGTAQCSEGLQFIKSHGVETANNCTFITHDFETNEGASAFAAKLWELKGQHTVPPLEMLEMAKAVDNKFVACFRLPAAFAKSVEGLHALSTYLGDFTTINQYFQVEVATSKSVKEILVDKLVSVVGVALEHFRVSVSLLSHKELPVKLVDYMSQKHGPGSSKGLQLMGHLLGSFRRFTLTLDMGQPPAETKEFMTAILILELLQLVQKLHQVALQFDVLDILKLGHGPTKILLCVTPFLRVEANLDAPTAFSAFYALAKK